RIILIITATPIGVGRSGSGSVAGGAAVGAAAAGTAASAEALAASGLPMQASTATGFMAASTVAGSAGASTGVGIAKTRGAAVLDREPLATALDNVLADATIAELP